jgi:hypothetical protein
MTGDDPDGLFGDARMRRLQAVALSDRARGPRSAAGERRARLVPGVQAFMA